MKLLDGTAASARENRQRRMETLHRLKNKPCMDCGNNYPPECMDWDHRPGEIKLFTIALKPCLGWNRLWAEILKCDLVCANCHRTRTKSRYKRKSLQLT